MSNDTSYIAFLNYITAEFNRSLAVFISLFGVIGNILNIFVFSQRIYHWNSCGWIFLVLSIVDLVSLVSGLSTLIIAGWTINPTSYIGPICKIRAFLVFSTRTMATWLMVLATIDRWLQSSINARHRQKSSLKNS
ncbi:unnamed protein product [Rotaria sp. Silwood2]|nr:unnamed protein product [Rotaria sp. Silwood2]CAF3393562.1 unnamed protein product [Rotaria sp. Silwood2]CAF4482985.1 unnamed protein product [Rotaria sp. Silwood2]CAF4568650.1 unnamed protein product [Rotaria sp. Silwood2]